MSPSVHPVGVKTEQEDYIAPSSVLVPAAASVHCEYFMGAFRGNMDAGLGAMYKWASFRCEAPRSVLEAYSISDREFF